MGPVLSVIAARPLGLDPHPIEKGQGLSCRRGLLVSARARRGGSGAFLGRHDAHLAKHGLELLLNRADHSRQRLRKKRGALEKDSGQEGQEKDDNGPRQLAQRSD